MYWSNKIIYDLICVFINQSYPCTLAKFGAPMLSEWRYSIPETEPVERDGMSKQCNIISLWLLFQKLFQHSGRLYVHACFWWPATLSHFSNRIVRFLNTILGCARPCIVIAPWANLELDMTVPYYIISFTFKLSLYLQSVLLMH